MTNNEEARIRDIARQLARALRTAAELNEWITNDVLLARRTMPQFMPVAEQEFQGAICEGNQGDARDFRYAKLQITPTSERHHEPQASIRATDQCAAGGA